MIKALNRFRKIIIILSISLFSIILYSALLNVGSSKYLNRVFNNSHIIYWIGTFLLLAFVIVMHRVIQKVNIKKLKYITLAEVIILLFCQIFIITTINPVQVTDSYLINDQAASIASNIDDQVDYTFSSYFKRYSNNNFCLLITVYLSKFFKFINIDYTLGLTIFNTIMIDLSLLFGYLIFRKIRDKRDATEFLTINILNPLNYLMIHWTYTCTYSIVFMVLSVYLALLLKDEKAKPISKVVYSILLGLCLTIGYLLRPIIVIPIIAIIICFIILIIQKRIKIKQFVLSLIIIVFVSGGSFIGLNYKIKQYIPDSSNTFPITHWIMMGLHGKGTVNSADNRFTESFETKEEKKKANLIEIKKTLKEYRFTGLVHHLLVKLPVTWSNGTSDYYVRSYQDQKQGLSYQYLIDGKNDLMVVYCQSFRIMIIILTILSLISQLKKTKIDFIFFNTLLIFGAIIFYLIWEAKSAYSIPFLPFLFVLALNGINILNENINEKITFRTLKNIFMIVIIITITLSIALFKPFARNRFPFNYYSVNVTNTGSSSFINNINKDDIVVKQEFYSKRKFNKILLYAKTDGENNDVKYKITLRNSDNDIINEFTIDNSDIIKNYVTLKIDIDNTEANKKYIIEIKKNNENQENKDSIEFGYVYSKYIDTYKGDMYLNDKMTNDKLFIKVYDKRKTLYMSKAAYILLSGSIILVEFLLYFYFKRSFKPVK